MNESLTESPATVPPTEDAASAESPSQNRNWYRAWGMPVSTIVIIGLGLIWARYFFDPLQGRAIVNFVTVSLVGSLAILLAFWFCCLSYFSRRTVLTIMIPLVLVGIGWAASVRSVEFDGDMNADFVYRWEPKAQLQEVQTAELAGEDKEFVVTATDMPAYRGLNRDGIVVGPALNTNWEGNPPKELWRTNVGEGYASMAVVGDSLITLEQRDTQEAITCYDTKTGQLKWKHAYEARFFEAMGGLGPRTTPTVVDGQVYSAGASGDVVCLDFWTGKPIWSRNLLEELEIPNVIWGISSSPLIYQNMVVVNVGGPAGDGLVALDRETGKTIWQAEGTKEYTAEQSTSYAGYSSPDVMTIRGVEQIVMFDGFGLTSYEPLSGRRLWNYEHKNGAGVNAAQPILLDDGQHIFISASYGMGSALVDIQKKDDNWTATKVWHDTRVLRSKFANAIYHSGHVFGLDEGILMCIDPLTGDKRWKSGRYGHGQMLLTHELLVILAEDGTLNLVAADPTEFRQLATMTVLPNATKVWNPPALADGIVYVRDHREMAAFDLRENP